MKPILSLIAAIIFLTFTAAGQQQRPLRECTLPPQPEALTQKWPGGIVYYEFDAQVTSADRALMQAAMSEWANSGAGVSFVPRTPGVNPNFVYIKNDAGNWSNVGMTGNQQDLGIFNWDSRFVMAHELCHALGFWHEQSRWDRDASVQVDCGNVQQGCQGTVYGLNFGIRLEPDWIASRTPYDFDSVMHYGKCAFSVNCLPNQTCNCALGSETINVPMPNVGYENVIGQLTHLSVGDILDMKEAYGCSGASGWERGFGVPGAGTNGTIVYDFVSFDDDGPGPNRPRLCLGGDFTSVGGIAANRIAMWDGVSWSSLGSGMNGSVNALIVWDADGLGPTPPALFAGGGFTSAGGVPANRVAKWNGSGWSPLGSGMSAGNDYVTDFAVFDADGPLPGLAALYVGGQFTNGGNVGAKSIAKWDGTAWSVLGSGLNSDVIALEVFDFDGSGPNPAELIAGGGFVTSGAISVNRIAKWNGSTWSALLPGVNNGVNSDVRSLLVFDADGSGPNHASLIVGGNFTTAGGIGANRVARWNGTSWSALGTGMLGTHVYALSEFDEDGSGPALPSLCAGGAFTTAGGIGASNIATWNGSAWSPLLGGVNNPVQCLTAFDDGTSTSGASSLYVGGSFTIAGGVLSSHVAKWYSCGSPSTTYCTAKTNSLGCTPTIGASGFSSATSGSGFTISAASVLNLKIGILLYRNSVAGSGQGAISFAGGTLCFSGSPNRTTPVVSGGTPAPVSDCSGVFAIDMNAFAQGLITGPPAPQSYLLTVGQEVCAQYWGRDPGFPPPNNTQLSDALMWIIGS